MKEPEILLILLVLLTGCTKDLKISRSCSNPNDCISSVVDYINNHVDGVNQLNTDEFASFESDSNVLIIYIGKSRNDYFKKWEIPLEKVDINSIEMEEEEFSGHPLSFRSNNNEYYFRFYEDNEFKTCTSKFKYYPGASNGSKPRFRKQFVISFKKAVELSK